MVSVYPLVCVIPKLFPMKRTECLLRKKAEFYGRQAFWTASDDQPGARGLLFTSLFREIL
jgi:hypothetical protein